MTCSPVIQSPPPHLQAASTPADFARLRKEPHTLSPRSQQVSFLSPAPPISVGNPPRRSRALVSCDLPGTCRVWQLKVPSPLPGPLGIPKQLAATVTPTRLPRVHWCCSKCRILVRPPHLPLSAATALVLENLPADIHPADHFGACIFHPR